MVQKVLAAVYMFHKVDKLASTNEKTHIKRLSHFLFTHAHSHSGGHVSST